MSADGRVQDRSNVGTDALRLNILIRIDPDMEKTYITVSRPDRPKDRPIERWLDGHEWADIRSQIEAAIKAIPKT